VKVISNSSPLINFAAIGRFTLLRELYGTIIIPNAVYHEVVVAGRGQPGAAEVEQADWVVRETVSNPTIVAALHELGRGEAEAIALAVENPGSLLILDERRGRLAALQLGVHIIGTLGVLVVAKRKRLIPALAPEMDKLQTQVGFRVRADLRAKVLQEVGEEEEGR
jgi:predicted nucleic acid-binding protein